MLDFTVKQLKYRGLQPHCEVKQKHRTKSCG